MNKAILVGRLTRDPEVRYSQDENATAVARYTVAVDRRFKRDGEPTADFIRCLVFGRSAEFAEQYFRQGMRVSISGRIQTGSYTNKDGVKNIEVREMLNRVTLKGRLVKTPELRKKRKMEKSSYGHIIDLQ